MKNFTIILFIFFILFLSISLASTDSFSLFLLIFLAFIISFICLFAYLGKIRGLLIFLAVMLLPFLLEYLFYKYKLPYFSTPLFKNISSKQINLPITLSSLFTIFTIPLLLITALFFAQKIRLIAAIKTYHKTFLVLVSALLIALNFLAISKEKIDFQSSFKWLIISLLILGICSKLFKFKPDCPELFKEAPIIIYLALYGLSAFKGLNYFNWLMVGLLTIYYLWLLYSEYKIRKISRVF